MSAAGCGAPALGSALALVVRPVFATKREETKGKAGTNERYNFQLTILKKTITKSATLPAFQRYVFCSIQSHVPLHVHNKRR